MGVLFRKQTLDTNGMIVLNNNMFSTQTNNKRSNELSQNEPISLIEMFFKTIENQPIMTEQEIRTNLMKYVPGQFSQEMNARIENAQKRKSSENKVQIFDSFNKTKMFPPINNVEKPQNFDFPKFKRVDRKSSDNFNDIKTPEIVRKHSLHNSDFFQHSNLSPVVFDSNDNDKIWKDFMLNNGDNLENSSVSRQN